MCNLFHICIATCKNCQLIWASWSGHSRIFFLHQILILVPPRRLCLLAWGEKYSGSPTQLAGYRRFCVLKRIWVLSSTGYDCEIHEISFQRFGYFSPLLPFAMTVTRESTRESSRMFFIASHEWFSQVPRPSCEPDYEWLHLVTCVFQKFFLGPNHGSGFRWQNCGKVNRKW